MKEYTNTYTQVRNNIITRQKHKILAFSNTDVNIIDYASQNKIQIDNPLSEEELDLLVDELNQCAIICECEDTANQEENC